MTSPRVLVLGGTSFVGRHLVESLRTAGAEVTLFHRGRTGPGLFAGLEHLLGDRDGDVSALAGRTWDACVDVSAYTPEQVARTAAHLGDAVPHHVLVSTISVYSVLAPGADEGAPLIDRPREELAPGSAEEYGALKVLAEREAAAAFADLAVVRPGIVAGPYDPTDRFTSWVRRFAQPGPHPAPPLGSPMQYVDARDLGDFLARCALQRVTGTYNAVRPTVRLGDVLAEAARAGGVEPDVVELGVEECLALADAYAARSGGSARPATTWPMWLPPGGGPGEALWQVDAGAATAAGLAHRPVADTVADTLAWVRAEDPPQTQGLDRAAEERALERPS